MRGSLNGGSAISSGPLFALSRPNALPCGRTRLARIDQRPNVYFGPRDAKRLPGFVGIDVLYGSAVCTSEEAGTRVLRALRHVGHPIVKVHRFGTRRMPNSSKPQAGSLGMVFARVPASRKSLVTLEKLFQGKTGWALCVVATAEGVQILSGNALMTDRLWREAAIHLRHAACENQQRVGYPSSTRVPVRNQRHAPRIHPSNRG